jgi:hypothetical protein
MLKTCLRSGDAYFLFLVLTVTVTEFSRFFFGDSLILKAQPFAIYGEIIGLLIALCLWLSCTRQRTESWFFISIAALVLVLWTMLMGLSIYHDDVFGINSAVLPIAILMLLFKFPGQQTLRKGADWFAWCSLILVALSLFMVAIGVRSTTTYELHWPSYLNLTLSLPTWHEPFDGPAMSALVGAVIAVWGLYRGQWPGRVFVLFGLGLVFLGDVVGVAIAAVAGMSIVLLARYQNSGSNAWKRSRVLLLIGFPIALVLIFVFRVDPTLSGRVGIWHDYLGLWRSSAFFGLGSGGVDAAKSSIYLQPPNGHNIIVNVLPRWGVLIAILVLLLFALCITFGVIAYRCGNSIGLALVTLIAVVSLTEVLYDFRYLSVPLIMLLIASAFNVYPGWSESHRLLNSSTTRKPEIPV